MNATQPVFQAQPSGDAAQTNASTSTDSPSSRANSQDFAAALSDAGSGKPARKNTAGKPHGDSGGGAMPPAGNQPPLALGPPPAARTPATPAAQDGGEGGVAGPRQASAADSAATGASAVASGADAAAGSPADGTLSGAPSNAPSAPGGQAAQDPRLPAGIAPGLAAIAADSAVADGAAAEATADPSVPIGPGMPHATAMVAAPKVGLPPAAAAPRPQNGAAKPGNPPAPLAKAEGATGKPAITAANSAASSDDAASFSTTTSGLAASNADPTAQAIMAATAQIASAPATQSSPADDSVAEDAGVAPGVLGSTASPAAAAASTAMQEATATAAAVTAATTAATAASIAQALSASAGPGVADKRSRAGGADSSISGSSNDGTAGAAQLLGATVSTSSTDTSPTPTLKVAAGVDTADFGQGVADRVSLMMDGNLTSAKLQVNPPALGPIEVRIALQSGHAQVWFTSHSAVTRDALESTAPKLREMLGAQGFGQVSVDISQRSFQERSPQPKGYEGAAAIGSESSAPVQSPGASSRAMSGLLDAYA